MSATGFLVLLIVTIAILMVLIMKVKLHPTFALFLSALFMGLVLGRFEAEGFGFTDILTTITGGFGGTLGSMGIPIMLGAILAMGVQDTGAAKAIANSFIKLFRGKNLELAPALTAYIVSIPVFGDITTILTSNIANVLSKRKHISMGKMAAFTQTGLNLTHAMVPPTPGILAVSILLGADLGLVIGWGILISLIAFVLTWLVLRKWTDKEFVEPVPEVVAEIEETSSNDVKDILITGNDIPATFASFLTILIPVVLIAGSSFIKMVVAEDSALYAWANIFGDKIVALGLGVIYTMLLAVFHKASVRKSNADATGKNPQSFREVVLNSWIARGLEIALPALLITGSRYQGSSGHQRSGRSHRAVRRSGSADPVPHRRYHVHRSRLHDHRRHDRSRRCRPDDGHPGSEPDLHRSGNRRRHHDLQPRQQLRLLGYQPFLQPRPQAGPEVHHPARLRSRHLLLRHDLRRGCCRSVLKTKPKNIFSQIRSAAC